MFKPIRYRALIRGRLIAKTAKDFKKADELRDILLKKGIEIDDLPDNECFYGPIDGYSREWHGVDV